MSLLGEVLASTSGELGKFLIVDGSAGLLGNFQKVPIDSMDPVVEVQNNPTDSEDNEELRNRVSAHDYNTDDVTDIRSRKY